VLLHVFRERQLLAFVLVGYAFVRALRAGSDEAWAPAVRALMRAMARGVRGPVAR
jgi:hypothetical protein